MTRQLFGLGSLGVSWAIILAIAASAQKPRPLIGTIQNDRDISGAGCSLSPVRRSQNSTTAPEKMLFWSDFGPTATLNIDGRDVRLPLKKPIGSSGSKIGHRVIWLCGQGQTTAQIKLRQTSVCGSGDQECEGVNFQGTMTVTKGRKTQTVAVTGNCGS